MLRRRRLLAVPPPAETPADAPGAGVPPHGAGSAPWATVHAESEEEGPFEVTGTLPPELDGVLVRNGPGPLTAAAPWSTAWCEGAGLVHAIELAKGRAVSHRSRWVRTPALCEALGLKAPGGVVEPIDAPANANVVCHAGRLLALAEGGLPQRLTPRLATAGLEDFEGMVNSPVSPRPRVDPLTGALVMFGCDPFGPPYLRYHEVDAGGTVVHSTPIELRRPSQQHDFGVTRARVVFLDLPAIRRGAPGAGPGQVAWDEAAGARLGLLRRGASGERVRWFEMEPRFAYHVMNAFDAPGRTVLDVVRHPSPRAVAGGNTAPVLERWEVAPSTGRVTTTQLDDHPVEWPRIDERRSGLRHRFGYCAAPAGRATPVSGPLVRYDLERGERAVYDPGPGRVAGEPVVAPAPGTTGEDEGWLLSLVDDPRRGASDLVVIDLSDFGGRAQAVIHLPGRVPLGLHGSWVPREEWPVG